MARTSFLWIMALAIILPGISCQKGEDGMNPDVEFIRPAENGLFALHDTIIVEAEVSDETALTSIQVLLTDHSYIAKGYLVNIPVTSNPQHFTVEYPLSGLNLQEGDYYIQVRVSDGVNTKFKYRPVRLEGEPLELKGLMLVTSPAPGSCKVQRLDPGSTGLQTVFSMQHQYASSCLSVQNGQLYVAGKGFGECYAIDMEDYTIDFNLQQTGTPSLTYHEKMLAAGDRFYLGLTDGFIHGFNKLGIQQFSATMTPGRKPGMMADHRSAYLVVAEEQKTGTGSWIASYFFSSGARWAEYKLPDGLKVTALASLNADELLIAGNLNGAGRLLIWNLTANALSTPWQAVAGEIHDMVRTPEGRFLMAHDQALLLYDASQQTAITILAEPGIRILCHDPDSGTLFAGKPGNVTAYRLSDLTVVWQKSLTESLLGIHLQY